MDDLNLLNIVKAIIEKIPDINIYIHTWNIVSSSISWREITENNAQVTSEYILNYFNDIRANIRHIEISDESSIELIGDTSGNVGWSMMPKIGWKRMWYGKYKILSMIKSKITNTKTIVINMRFDIHIVKDYYQNKTQILEFIDKIYRSQNCEIEFQKDDIGSFFFVALTTLQ
jgi:hypothetical protein